MGAPWVHMCVFQKTHIQAKDSSQSAERVTDTDKWGIIHMENHLGYFVLEISVP